jgi:uncharacterized membrane protein
VWRVNAAGVVSSPVHLPYPEGDLRGGPSDLTEQINGITHVIGATGDQADFPSNAVMWSVSVETQGQPALNSGPTILSSAYAAANGINASVDVVGEAVFDGGGMGWPFLKSANGQDTALAGLTKATFGSALDINDIDQIVGTLSYISRGSFIHRAVLWTSPLMAVDLNGLVSLGRGEKLTSAGLINSRGDIVASINGSTPCLLLKR